jgi:hypothetical protein
MGGPYNMGSSVQQLPQPPQPTGWSMPPLPPGPPPPMHAGATSAAPMLGSNVGAALQHQQLGSLPSMPPLPPGPPPPTATPPRPSYDQAAVNTAFVSSSSQHTRAGMSADCSPASLSPPLPSVSVNGPLDCPGALIGASVLTPSIATQTTAKLPAALLNTGANSNEHNAIGHGHTLLAGSNQGMGIISGNSAAARPLAYAPSADPPLPQPPPPMPSMPSMPPMTPMPPMPPMPPMSTPTKPLAAAPAPSALSPSDELALLAMDLHLKGSAFSDENTDFWSPIRSPLKCNATTGKVEAIGSGRPPALTHAKANTIAGGAESPSPYSVPDSPLEPGLSKREASFQTQMVRRAVSFIFNEDEATSSARRSPLAGRDL